MKRCPECRRDYYDDSLFYCLEDGAALIQGSVPSPDEPATMILSGAENSTTNIKEPEDGITPVEGRRRTAKRNWIIAGAIGIVIVSALAIASYSFYGRSTEQIASIAVMPFANDSGNPEIEYLSDGMTETLIKSLSQVPSLAVKSRHVVFAYKEKETDPRRIGYELGVQAVLFGRITARGEILKVALELVNTRTEDVIWSDQYETSRTEIIGLQARIARDVSATLRNQMSGIDKEKVARSGTSNAEAYQAYLRGRYHFHRRTAADLKKAIEEFQRATDIDSNYALAFSGLADAYALYSDYTGTPSAELATKVRAFAERAIALDAQLGEPHATLGILNVQDRRWDEALREAKTAVDLNPTYPTGVQWYASILLDLGRYDEAAEMMGRARELDPISAAISNGLSNTYEVRNDLDAAIANSLRYIEMNPSFPTSYRDLGFYYSRQGRHAEAIASGEKAVALERASYLLGDLGYIYASAGREHDAMTIVGELETRYRDGQSAGRYIAEVYSGLEQYEKAMQWLEKDFQSKNGRLSEIRWTIPYYSMHSYPPFKDLIRRMGLPPI